MHIFSQYINIVQIVQYHNYVHTNVTQIATTQHKLSSYLKSLLYFSKQSMIMVGHFIQYKITW